MITSVKELQQLLAEDSKEFDEWIFKRRFLMTSPGCSAERIEELRKALPRIPDSYTKWVKEVNLNGISVGYFQLSPRSNSKDMIEDLIQLNLEDPFLPKEFLEKYNLIWIGSNNDYTVYVSKGGQFKEGEIILVDEEVLMDLDNPAASDIVRIAKDFEQFLIVAANLSECQGILNAGASYEKSKVEFLNRMKQLGVPEEYHQGWLRVL